MVLHARRPPVTPERRPQGGWPSTGAFGRLVTPGLGGVCRVRSSASCRPCLVGCSFAEVLVDGVAADEIDGTAEDLSELVFETEQREARRTPGFKWPGSGRIGGKHESNATGRIGYGWTGANHRATDAVPVTTWHTVDSSDITGCYDTDAHGVLTPFYVQGECMGRRTRGVQLLMPLDHGKESRPR